MGECVTFGGCKVVTNRLPKNDNLIFEFNPPLISSMKPYINYLIIGVSVVLSSFLLAGAFAKRHKSTTSISVTGLGKKDFTSDLIVWSGSFGKKNINLQDAYAELGRDRDSIQQYMVSKGIKPEEIIFSSISIDKEFDHKYDNYGNEVSSTFTGYNLMQDIEIESGDVDRVESISRQVSELINSGIELYSTQPEYYYTKLSELKVEMIAEATKDANLRAQKIADNAGSHVGKLKKADMGVFQIVARNSAEDYSWGGSFNTTAKNKTASITVSLEYETR